MYNLKLLINIYYYYYFVLYIVIFILLLWSPFLPPMNLDTVLTYNHIALISLRRRSRINASMVLMRSDHLYIYTII